MRSRAMNINMGIAEVAQICIDDECSLDTVEDLLTELKSTAQTASGKKKAAAVANSSEMSEAMKLNAISKAMRGQDASRLGKTYVISKKGGGTKGGKGIKLVDKRMKNDKRSMDRSTKKKKNGKKGGMTGSKKRRHHK